MTTFRTFVADSDGVNAEYDKPKPKRGLARQVQKHVQGLSPERKAALGRIMKKAGIAGLAAYAAKVAASPPCIRMCASRNSTIATSSSSRLRSSWTICCRICVSYSASCGVSSSAPVAGNIALI